MNNQSGYEAFISYKHHPVDMKVAQDVQKQIDRASGIPERAPGRRPMEKDRGRGGDLR